ncbi:hypothetical protein ACRS38_04600 [Staphylococcus epidermidis]
MENVEVYSNNENIFYYQENGIRKTMCEGCPHKLDVQNGVYDDMDECFATYGHSHRCHRDGDKEIACRGVCQKAIMMGKTLKNESELNADY